MKKIPVILDTDIGDDIDDSWAVAMLLNSPELDVKLITTVRGDPEPRARIVAKMLAAAGRTDIPVGIGVPCGKNTVQIMPWIDSFDPKAAGITMYPDGVNEMIRVIMSSSEMVTLIAIGQVTNIAEALRREPRIAERARIVAMFGSIAKHHKTNREEGIFDGIIPEWNVKQDVAAAQAMFRASWPITITPLDTCADIVLSGEHYKRAAASTLPVTRTVMESYAMWRHGPDTGKSSILFDTVAVYLAFSEDLLEMEEMMLAVDDEGYTRKSDSGRPVRTAIRWKDRERLSHAFKELLVSRL
ncbi:MAG: nucleoside hydrolase [Spirochaetota bacterium]